MRARLVYDLIANDSTCMELAVSSPGGGPLAWHKGSVEVGSCTSTNLVPLRGLPSPTFPRSFRSLDSGSCQIHVLRVNDAPHSNPSPTSILLNRHYASFQSRRSKGLRRGGSTTLRPSPFAGDRRLKVTRSELGPSGIGAGECSSIRLG